MLAVICVLAPCTIDSLVESLGVTVKVPRQAGILTALATNVLFAFTLVPPLVGLTVTDV